MGDFGAGVGSNVEVVWHWVLAISIAFARPAAMLSLNPVFTRVQLTGVIRGAVAIALAYPIIPIVEAALPRDGLGFFAMLLTVKEAIIGASLGLLLGAPFWALEVAGDILDAQRGATQGRLNDPAGFADVSVSGTMLVIAGIALFAITGGFETMADLLYRSWSLWKPLGALPELSDRSPLLLLGLLDGVTRQGLLMATPVAFALLLSDVSLIVLTRVTPQLRVDDLALSLRGIVFSIVMPLYVLFLLTYVRQDLAGLSHLFDAPHMSVGGPDDLAR
jgi:type III secretion protein T